MTEAVNQCETAAVAASVSPDTVIIQALGKQTGGRVMCTQIWSFHCGVINRLTDLTLGSRTEKTDPEDLEVAASVQQES